jgi:hypothetical protein
MWKCHSCAHFFFTLFTKKKHSRTQIGQSLTNIMYVVEDLFLNRTIKFTKYHMQMCGECLTQLRHVKKQKTHDMPYIREVLQM